MKRYFKAAGIGVCISALLLAAYLVTPNFWQTLEVLILILCFSAFTIIAGLLFTLFVMFLFVSVHQKEEEA